MARWLKQSTAVTFRLGPFVDSGDGCTAETGLTIAQADIQISKAGGAFAQTSDAAPTTTHDADGWYQLPLTSTDTNTLGSLTVQVVMAGALPVWEHFMVLPANVYDSLVAGTDTLDVQVTGMGAGVVTAAAVATDAIDADAIADNAIDAGAIATGAITAAKFGAGAIDAAAIATDAIDADALKADALTEIEGAVWDATRAGHVTVGSFGQGVASVQGSVTGSVASVTGAVGSVTGAVGSVTGSVGGNVTGSVGSVTGAVGSVGAGGIAAASFAAGAINAAAVATGAIDADALASDAVDEIVDQVWDELVAGHAGAGSTGLTLAGALAPSAATVADAVWDEALAGHLAGGSTGSALNAASSAGDPWNTAIPGAYPAGSAGKIVGDNLNAPVGTVDTVVDAIKLKTDLIPGSPAAVGSAMTLTAAYDAAKTAATQASVDTIDDYIDTEIAAIKAKTDNLPASPAAVGSAMALTSSERDSTAAALLDLAAGVETGLTLRQAFRVMVGALAGKVSGADTGVPTFRNIADTKNRIIATTDASGNRLTVTLDLT